MRPPPEHAGQRPAPAITHPPMQTVDAAPAGAKLTMLQREIHKRMIIPQIPKRNHPLGGNAPPGKGIKKEEGGRAKGRRAGETACAPRRRRARVPTSCLPLDSAGEGRARPAERFPDLPHKRAPRRAPLTDDSASPTDRATGRHERQQGKRGWTTEGKRRTASTGRRAGAEGKGQAERRGSRTRPEAGPRPKAPPKQCRNDLMRKREPRATLPHTHAFNPRRGTNGWCAPARPPVLGRKRNP